jgi:hypothetical protein
MSGIDSGKWLKQRKAFLKEQLASGALTDEQRAAAEEELAQLERERPVGGPARLRNLLRRPPKT